uniref:BSD domain containing 1 n=1 Tax=Scleropages formosus TaxID=113540 RepID=A0A8C9SCF0_SCLFO
MATPAGTTEEYDSTKARLYSLQADPATYCNEPDGESLIAPPPSCGALTHSSDWSSCLSSSGPLWRSPGGAEVRSPVPLLQDPRRDSSPDWITSCLFWFCRYGFSDDVMMYNTCIGLQLIPSSYSVKSRSAEVCCSYGCLSRKKNVEKSKISSSFRSSFHRPSDLHPSAALCVCLCVCGFLSGPPEQFDTWLSGFSLEEKKGEISELLVSSPSIRALYTKMVPAAVSHSEFWQRYFYKVFQLDQEEARRVALKQRAERTAHSEALGWEEEEEDEFLGASSASRLDFAHPSQEVPPRARDQATVPLVSTVPAEQEGDRCDPGSESVSLPTQLETRAHEGQVAPAPEELNQKLGEATLEEGEAGPGVAQRHGQLQGRGSGAEQAANASGREEAAVVRAPARPGSAREDGPQDLRVFELNSDSGKSTPSNNGQKGEGLSLSLSFARAHARSSVPSLIDFTTEDVCRLGCVPPCPLPVLFHCGHLPLPPCRLQHGCQRGLGEGL